MALTVTTDLTNITTAETDTGWTDIGTQSAVLEPDFFVQGSNSESRAVSGTGASKGMVFDNGAGIDFTTGTHKDKLVYIWMRSNTPGLMELRANGGMSVRLATTSASADYRDWYISGSDVWADNDGWVCFVIDPQSAGTATTGSYVATSVRYFGGYMTTTTTAKGQNFGIDRISYGRGEIRVTGTVTTAGAGMAEIAAWDWDTAKANRWGIVTVKGGVYYVKGKIVIGHATTDTTWSSTDEQAVFETTTYYNGTNVVRAMPDASVGATAGSDGKTTYSGIGFIGGSGATTITTGVLVGTDAGRSGLSATVPINTDLTTDGRVLSSITVTDATMALSLYGSTFTGFADTVDLTGTGVADDDLFGTVFNSCGAFNTNMEARNDVFIGVGQITASGKNMNGSRVSGYEGTANTSALVWNEATDPAGELDDMVFAMGTALTHGIEFGLSSPTTIGLVGIIFNGYSASTDVNNSMLHFKRTTGTITLNITGGGTTPSWRTDGAVIDLVLNPVDTTVTTVTTAGAVIPSVNVFLKAATGTGLPIAQVTTIVNSGTTATATTTGVHGLATNDQVLIEGASLAANNGVFTVTGITSTTIFTYTMLTTPGSSPTGSITTTFVFLYGATNGSGVITVTRAIPSTFTVDGWARKGSASPYYKQGPISGSVTAASGGTFRAVMVAD